MQRTHKEWKEYAEAHGFNHPNDVVQQILKDWEEDEKATPFSDRFIRTLVEAAWGTAKEGKMIFIEWWDQIHVKNIGPHDPVYAAHIKRLKAGLPR